jgi:hypothetical protein
MKFLDTYESILIWQLRNGIKVNEDYFLLFNQIRSCLYVPYEDDKTNNTLCRVPLRTGAKERTSMCRDDQWATSMDQLLRCDSQYDGFQ